MNVSKISSCPTTTQAAGLASQRQQGSDSGSLPPQGQGAASRCCWKVRRGEIPAAERGLRTWDGGAQEGRTSTTFSPWAFQTCLWSAGFLPTPAPSLDPWTSPPLGPKSMATQQGRAKHGSQATQHEFRSIWSFWAQHLHVDSFTKLCCSPSALPGGLQLQTKRSRHQTRRDGG